MNLDSKPLPRFWYFPRGDKAVVVMTGDDHGNGGTAGRFDQYLAQQPGRLLVDDWECMRFTSYIYPNTPLTNAQAAAYTRAGLRGRRCTSDTDCARTSRRRRSTSDVRRPSSPAGAANYPSLPAPGRPTASTASRGATGPAQPKTELANGIRLDTNYYYWPGPWMQDRPGLFTGSGMPMRFADTDGTMIDVYQAATQMTDESGQTYPFTSNTLLDNALGPGLLRRLHRQHAHRRRATRASPTRCIASAQARGVPVVSGRQMLTWLDGRNASSFGSSGWNGSALSFTITPGAGANGLQAMLPFVASGGLQLSAITRGGDAGAPSNR